MKGRIFTTSVISCMATNRVDLGTFTTLLQSGCGYLELNREILDNLNVYPVPDGDTGVNMVATFKPAVDKVCKSQCAAFADVSKVMCDTLTGNSRGNSGFILAQFFKGFWEAVGKTAIEYIDSKGFEQGFAQGHFAAVSSLLSPVEGTMITIIACMAEAMKRLEHNSIVHTLETAVEAGERGGF